MQFNYTIKSLEAFKLSVSRQLFDFKWQFNRMTTDDSYYEFYKRSIAGLENNLRELDEACKILNEATE